jgi:hypothetical protein
MASYSARSSLNPIQREVGREKTNHALLMAALLGSNTGSGRAVSQEHISPTGPDARGGRSTTSTGYRANVKVLDKDVRARLVCPVSTEHRHEESAHKFASFRS